MWPSANAAIPPSTGSGSGTRSCSAPPLKKSPTVPRAIPAANSATVVAAAERLKPRNHIHAAPTRNSDEARCETSRMVLGGHATASGSEKLTSVPPKSAVAQSVQKPAARRAAIVSLSTPPRALAEERGGISESADAVADAVMSDLELESVCRRISFSIHAAAIGQNASQSPAVASRQRRTRSRVTPLDVFFVVP